MKLTYRGVSYDRAPASLEVTEGNILGKYRGQVTRRRCVVSSVERPDVESVLLHYRGGSYATMQPAIPASLRERRVNQAPAPSCPVRLPQLSRLMSQDVRQVHLENMRRSLESRIQSAQARGDQHLVSLLRQESSNLWLSH
ncbi:hypothetical protein Lepto7376_0140 [[Leptolyngbya] sp. PCC 7376]|uniref:DUF4278 domain-containing protein n=1 Tax=[Leptolyngbya] sp. PCC 7376 TaxID=111781 RepID=UPI00029F419B|nr:DUF4278 domain-containing protein [[Leptolyngbya] sp. PCC 7376]AFY36588.1 hypothetical protein Lepto7376_0140 [[Leptolyngbya] sp. PCC 7376]